jgi:hypothetical protein
VAFDPDESPISRYGTAAEQAGHRVNKGEAIPLKEQRDFEFTPAILSPNSMLVTSFEP